MTDQKITALTESSAITDADLLPVVQNVSTVPVTRAKTGTQVRTWLNLPASGSSSKYLGQDGQYHEIPSNRSLFASNTASDIATYKSLTTTLPTGSIANTATSISAADTIVEEFAAAQGVFDFIATQVLHCHTHLAQTAGTKTSTAYVKVYHRTSGGTETLMGTSEVSGTLAGSDTEYDFSIPVSDTIFAATDRILYKIFASPAGAGTTPTVAAYYEGTTGSRLEVGASVIPSRRLVPYYNANDVFRVANSPGGTSAWAGTFTAAGSSGTTIKYSTVSGTAASMKPSATTQLAKMRLYNTTRGNNVLIQDWVAGTITSVANYPANWVNGDTLTIASQTVSGGALPWVDLECTDTELTGRTQLGLDFLIRSATTDQLDIHPFETFGAGKDFPIPAQVANISSSSYHPMKLVSNCFSIAWSGAPTVVLVRVCQRDE